MQGSAITYAIGKSSSSRSDSDVFIVPDRRAHKGRQTDKNQDHPDQTPSIDLVPVPVTVIWNVRLRLSVGLARGFEQVFVLSKQNEFSRLVVDCHSCRHQTRLTLRRKIDNLKCRIERV